MEAEKSKICSVSWQAGDPGEPMVQLRSAGSLVDDFLLPLRPVPFVLFRTSSDWMRLILIVEGNLLYPELTDLNVNLIQDIFQVDT